VLISVFNGYKSVTPQRHVMPSVILDEIKNEVYGEIAKNIRNVKSKEQRDEIKSQLPQVTWGGQFTKRNVDNLVTSSGLLCIDIDNATIKELVAEDKYVVATWTSISGSGTAILFRVPMNLTKDNFKGYWRSAQRHIFNTYGYAADEANKSIVSTRCISSDKDLLSKNATKIINES